MVARAAGFIQRREGLVDQQDVHIVNILLDYISSVYLVMISFCAAIILC
jgi:hypothetical protein